MVCGPISKMVFYSVAGRLVSLELLLLVASVHYYAQLAHGQQVGVSLKLGGIIVPNNSLVDIEDTLYTTVTSDDQIPSNTKDHDQTLVCETDLVDCCDTPHTVRGTWRFPDGTIVPDTGTPTFRANRGPNEIINKRQFYGSVRLFRRYSPRTPRGRFCCELPSAADSSVNQTLCAYIVDFGDNPQARVIPVTISSSGSTTVGEAYSLMCSATLVTPIPLPSNIPSPTFKWLSNGNASLPSGVTSMGTAMSNNIYTSTLQFSPLSLSHAGMYTCRIGAGRLANSTVVTVNVPAPTVVVLSSSIPNPIPPFGSDLTLICNVMVTSGPGIDIPLNVAFELLRVDPAGSPLNTTLPSVSGSIHTTTAMISSFGRNDSGVYICRATVRSASANTFINDSGTTESLSVRVTTDNDAEQGAGVGADAGAIDIAMCSSCLSEVGIAVGVIIAVECLIVMMITVVLCLLRKKSSSKNNFAVSTSVNEAYGGVHLKSREIELEETYTNPDNILGKSGQWTETATTNHYETIHTSNLESPEYANMQRVCAIHQR